MKIRLKKSLFESEGSVSSMTKELLDKYGINVDRGTIGEGTGIAEDAAAGKGGGIDTNTTYFAIDPNTGEKKYFAGTREKVYDPMTGIPYNTALMDFEFRNFLAKFNSDPEMSIFSTYFTSEGTIVWSFQVSTAATDGINICFNPAFFSTMMAVGDDLVKQYNNKSFRFLPALFIIMHECYHIFLNHLTRADHLGWIDDGRKNNVAADYEVNASIVKSWGDKSTLDDDNPLKKVFTLPFVVNKIFGRCNYDFFNWDWATIKEYLQEHPELDNEFADNDEQTPQQPQKGWSESEKQAIQDGMELAKELVRQGIIKI